MARSSIVSLQSVDASDRCIDEHVTASVDERNITGRVWQRAVPVRWVRRGLVGVLLALPVVAVAVVAWPDDDGDAGGDFRADGSGPEGVLVVGDSVEGEIGFGEVAVYRLEGEGRADVSVAGVAPMDATLTVLDEDGDQVGFNDDTNGLDPELRVDLDDGQLTVEVRDLRGSAAAFTVTVRDAT
jgi:hypothetical protein